jgi:hypothetical protein
VRLVVSVLTQTVSLVLSGDEGEKMMNRKAPKIQFRILVALIAFVAMAASVLLVSTPVSAQKAPKKTKMDTPTIQCGATSPTTINVIVCAGATGAPAGFSIQWMTAADYAIYGWPADSGCPPDINGNPTCGTSFCKASFSGVPGCSSYNLGAGQCVEVQIGDNLFDACGASSTCVNQPLVCNTTYVFRAFAHANSSLNRSDFSTNLSCTTAPCGGGDTGGCTFTQGYWKTHGPIPTGNNVNEWDVTNLTLGTVNYTDLQLQAIFDTPAGGNGLVSLAHQLIAAKLNIANGANDSAIAATIASADALIGGLVIPPVGGGVLSPAATSSLTAALTAFNEGTIGPGHCP